MFHAHDCSGPKTPSCYATFEWHANMIEVIDRGIIHGQSSSFAYQGFGQSLPGTLDRSPPALVF